MPPFCVRTQLQSSKCNGPIWLGRAIKFFCEHFFYRITQKCRRMAGIVSKLNLCMRWTSLQYSYKTMPKIDGIEIAECRTDSWFLAVKRTLYCNSWNYISLMVLNLAVLKCKAGTFLLNCKISKVSLYKKLCHFRPDWFLLVFVAFVILTSLIDSTTFHKF